VSSYALEVWWRGDDDLEYFTLRCRTEEQLKLWETQINRLIKEVMSRRHAERGIHRATSQANSTNPALGRQFTQRSHDRKISVSIQPQSPHLGPPVVTPLLPSAISPGPFTPNAYGAEDHSDLTPSTPYATGNVGAQSNYGALAYEGFEFDEDELEDLGASSTADYSGRGTPLGAIGTLRRSNAMSMPPERDAVPGYDRPRAQTEDTNGFVISQWRTMPPVPLPATPAANILPLRPTTPRLHSTASLSSFSSSNETAGYQPSQTHYTKTLRGQPSQTKIRNGHDDGRAKATTPVPSSAAGGGPPVHRVRSTSQPTAYNASKSEPPPLPNAGAPWPSNESTTSVSSSPKRGSGSSQSTGESSEYSPNSSSPITPFGSSESSLAMGVRPSRSQGFDSAVNGGHGPVQFPAPVKVKVHYHEDIFVVQVPRTAAYTDLIDQVGKKIRLCGPRRDDGPLRVKYKDEDGDMVSVGSTEDVQMAFESFKPGGQVTLFVT
jgi:cell division control protein 24